MDLEGNIGVTDWGDTEGAAGQVFTITDGAECTARIGVHGARLVQLWLPDRDGHLADVVLGHDAPADYESLANTYFGATCGRYANRIAAGRFVLEGQTVQLDLNEGANHLHGGRRGFDRSIWAVTGANDRSVSMQLHSPDGDMGYPGAVEVGVTYAFTAPARLEITMTGTVEGRPTVLNMVNHAYFNLAGQGSGPVNDQLLQIAADHYLPVDAALLPLGAPARVADTPFDFRAPRPIGALVPPGGFDHNFCLTRGADPAVMALDPASGRGLRLWTNQPGVQVYTGSYIPEGLPGKAGQALGPNSGFTLETQAWPDSPNRPDYPPATLRPGQSYHHHMRLEFFTQPAT